MSKPSSAVVGRRLRRVLGALLTLGFGAAWWGFVPTSMVAAAPSPKVSEASAPKKVVRPPLVVTVAVTTPPAPQPIPDKVVPPAPPHRPIHKPPHHLPPRIVPVALPVTPVADPIVTPVSDPITPPIVVDLPLPPVVTDDDPIDDEPSRLPRIRTRSS